VEALEEGDVLLGWELCWVIFVIVVVFGVCGEGGVWADDFVGITGEEADVLACAWGVWVAEDGADGAVSGVEGGERSAGVVEGWTGCGVLGRSWRLWVVMFA
jgi:hypothetical protein